MPELIIRIPTALTIHAGGKAEVRVEADTLAQVLARLAEVEPVLASRLLADDGSRRPYVNLFLDGQDTRSIAPKNCESGRDQFSRSYPPSPEADPGPAML